MTFFGGRPPSEPGFVKERFNTGFFKGLTETNTGITVHQSCFDQFTEEQACAAGGLKMIYVGAAVGVNLC